MMTRVCSHCGKELPLTTECFYRNKRNKDGFQLYCKQCASKQSKKYYEANKINKNKNDRCKNEYQTCTQCGVELPATNKYFYKETRGGFKTKCKKCLRDNSLNPKYKEKRREWKKTNPILNNASGHRRKARERELPATLTDEQWNRVKKDFDYKCSYCGQKIKLTQDHFIPVSKGGEYTHNNIIPACLKCNSSKKDRDFFEWYPEYRYYSKARERAILNYLNYKDEKSQQLIIAI